MFASKKKKKTGRSMWRSRGGMESEESDFDLSLISSISSSAAPSPPRPSSSVSLKMSKSPSGKNRDYVYIKRITSLEIEVEKLRRRLHFAGSSITAAQKELVEFQDQQNRDTRKLQQRLVKVKRRYNALRRKVIMSRVRKVLMRVSFVTWKDVWIRWRMSAQALAERAQEASFRKQRALRLFIASVRHWGHRKLAAGFGRWAQFCVESNRARRIVERIIRRVPHGKCAIAMNRWRSFVALKERGDRERVLRMLQDQIDVAKRRENMQVILRVVGGMMKAQLSHGFRAWQDAVSMHKHLFERKRNAAELIDRVLGRITHAALTKSWNQWRFATRKMSENARVLEMRRDRARRAVQTAIRHWTHRKLSRGFETWIAACEEAERAKRVVERVVCRLLHSKCAAAVDRWKSFVSASKQEETESAFAHLERQLDEAKRRENMQVILRVVGGMMKAQLSHGFRSWQDAVNMHKHLFERRRSAIELIESVVGRMTHATLTRGWNRWQEGCRSKREEGFVRGSAIRTLKSTIRHWEHKKLARGFRKWHTNNILMRHDPMEKKKWALLLMRDSARRIHHASISSGAERLAFRLWHIHTAFDTTKRDHRMRVETLESDMRNQRDRQLDRFFRRWLLRPMSQGFRKWRESVFEWHTEDRERVFNHQLAILEERLVAQRRHQATRVLRRAMQHWHRSQLGTAFNNLRELVHNKDSQHQGIRRITNVFTRWTHRVLSRGFYTWRDCASNQDVKSKYESALGRLQCQLDEAKRRENMQVILRVVGGMMKAQLSHGFRTWQDAVSMHKHLFERKRNAAELIDRVLGRITHAALTKSWNQWRFATRKMSENARVLEMRRDRARRAVQTAIRHWTHRKLSRGFEAWIAACEEAERAKSVVERVVCRLLHSKCAAAVDRWRSFVSASKQEETEGKFASLQRQLDEAKRRENMQVILRVVGGMMKAQLSHGFRTWQDAVNMHKHLFERKRNAAELIDRVLGRITHAALTKSWNQWRFATRKMSENARVLEMRRDRARRAVQTAIRHWTHRKLSRGFETWIAACEEAGRAKSVVERVVCRLLHSKCAAAVDRWRSFVLASKQEETEGKFASLQRQLDEAKRRENMQVILRVVGGMMKAQLSHGFRTWQDAVNMHKHLFERKRNAAEHIDRVLGRITHAALTKSWNQWRFATRKMSENARVLEMRRDRARRAVQTAIRHWTHRKLSRGLETWIAACEEAGRAKSVVERVVCRLLHSKCAAAVDRWRSFVLVSKQEETEGKFASLQRQLDEAKRRENMQVILRVVGGMMKAQLSHGFRTWQDAVNMHKHLFERKRNAAELIDRVLGRITHATLSKGWNQWVTTVRAIRNAQSTNAHRKERSLHVIVSSLKHWRHRCLARGFRQWSVGILWRRGREERQQWAAHRMRRAILQIRRAHLAASWRTWARQVSEDREIDLTRARQRRALQWMLGKKHVSRIATLRIAFRKWHATGTLIATTSFYRDRFSRLRQELSLLQINGGVSRLRSLMANAQSRGLCGAFQRWRMKTIAHRLSSFRRKLTMYNIVKRMLQRQKRFAFDLIRRAAIQHDRMRLSHLEAHTMKRGMRTFLMVMIKTLKNKERLRMLRAFNKIFQYGMHMMHERIHFLQNKHADVVDFVRKLRKEMHVGTSSSKLEYDNNREARATGYATTGQDDFDFTRAFGSWRKAAEKIRRGD
eukprot:g1806.t1